MHYGLFMLNVHRPNIFFYEADYNNALSKSLFIDYNGTEL